MALTASPTELSTSATDAVLAVECVIVLLCLRRTPSGDRWRIGLWCWALGLLALASFLGSVVHGLEMPPTLRGALWKPLYLTLGLLMGLFLVGGFCDWHGRAVAERLIPWSIGLGAGFFGLTQFLDGSFIVFVAYEAVVMASALAIYCFLAATRRLKGAGILAAAIILNLMAGGVQASNVTFKLFIPFDHNGVFHLVQMVGIATLGLGLRRGMKSGAQSAPGEPRPALSSKVME